MPALDPITEALMDEGGAFEVVTRNVLGRELRVFKNAPETLSDNIDSARAYGELEFIVAGKRRYTFETFFAASDSFAARLAADYNVNPGQSVAICMKNSPEWMIAFVGILKAGAVAVLVNSRGTAETMLDAVTDTDCVLVLADARREEKLTEQGCAIPVILSDTIDVGIRSSHPVPNVTRKADDNVAMFFTSGTTGRAKAAAMSNRALVTGTMNTQMAMAAVFGKMAAAMGMDLDTLRSTLPQSCSLLIVPLFHTSGCSSMFLSTLINGGKLVLMDRWDADHAMELVETEKVTILSGVPATHWDILRSENRGNYDLSSLMSISSGGQAFPRNLLNTLRKTFPKTFIGAGYGMTETAGSISQATGKVLLAKPAASGTILPMNDVKIVSDEGDDLPVGETGEIWVKGATVMTEYYGRPDATKAAFEGDFFKTGDVGYVDEDGYIYIVDRKTDMVISGGENIYCVEVEAALNKHPDVLQVCTFGVPDDRLGEKLIACFVPGGESLTATDLEGFARENLAAYRVPKVFVKIDTPFVLNAMSKIEKTKVREAYLRGDYGA